MVHVFDLDVVERSEDIPLGVRWRRFSVAREHFAWRQQLGVVGIEVMDPGEVWGAGFGQPGERTSTDVGEGV